ncbi:helix-turn-helix domain-containing protein [Hahella sp. KA22]|uniref:helix-turn-helix domain-containing protein n=1 Tax=Hahella sp. KA22 TaxID=1628392 RepID=UPI000FDD6B54|nr:helix-turn-helix domain-containing protein [Hahella sp. KA22]AZZ94494.1 helix-turn-helix domain-containing protein [Hahella sp. KA22]QAY57867.1 helix-turn-helix domain-containing protein [Hahella sp. KA22]
MIGQSYGRESHPYGFELEGERHQPEAMTTAHQHCHLEILILTRGSVEMLYGQQTMKLSAGDLLCYSALHFHQFGAVSDDAVAYSFRLPLFALFNLQLSCGVKQQLFHGVPCRARCAGLVDDTMLARWVAELRLCDPALDDLILDEITLLLRRLFKDACYTPPDQQIPGVTGLKVSQHIPVMLQFINDNYHASISVCDVADHVGLHKNFAMTLFKKTLGMSILEYLTALRVHHARRMLQYTGEQVTQIAYASGFSSVTRFYEVFAKYFGESPQKYRKSCVLVGDE